MLFTLGPWGQHMGAGRDTLEQQVHHLLWGSSLHPVTMASACPLSSLAPKGFLFLLDSLS